ncbi:hypothetical protein [Yoonia sp.]
MTNGLAVFLGVVIVAALAIDGTHNDWTASLFLIRKFIDFVEYIAFWR